MRREVGRAKLKDQQTSECFLLSVLEVPNSLSGTGTSLSLSDKLQNHCLISKLTSHHHLCPYPGPGQLPPTKQSGVSG